MPRLISLTDAKKRDAQVGIQTAKKSASFGWVGPEGRSVANQRFIKATEKTSFEALEAEHGGDLEAVGSALIEGDPEIDLELVGRELGEVDRVWVREDGSVLYSARFLQVVYGPDGEEKSRQDFVDVEATVTEEQPLVWSGRMFPIDQVVRRFALVRTVQLRHINGLTFDFLYEIAKSLADEGKMLFVGAGGKGAQPLIFQSNGSPYRGFLEGRIDGDGYRLVLHLSNLELKRVDG